MDDFICSVVDNLSYFAIEHKTNSYKYLSMISVKIKKVFSANTLCMRVM